MLNDQTLRDFTRQFYGYGDYAAPFWFIGMEEGGGSSETEIAARLRAWDERGRRELEDLAGYHEAIHITKHWKEVPVLQPTWSRLIRIVLSYRGGDPSPEQVLEYLRLRLGRLESGTCLMELLPLPSPGTNRWLYRDISSIAELQDRDTYARSFSAWRAEHIRSRLDEHKPAFVIFYGLGYRLHWEAIAQAPFERSDDQGFRYARRDGTVSIAAAHPAAPGTTNDYFHAIGRWMGSVRKPIE